MKEVIKKNKHLLIFSLFLLFVVLFYLSKALLIQPDRHLPIESDEFFYYVNSYNYYINTTTQAAFTFGGKGAILGGGAAHGFMYSVFHGSIAKLFGWSNLTMIITNYIVVLLSILLLFFQKIKRLTLTNKIFCSLLILSFSFLPIFLQTYMQEVLHLFFAVCCGIFVVRIYEDPTKNKAKTIINFVIFLIVISLFRPSWLFWIVVLIPLSKNKKEFIFWIFISLLFFSLSFVFNKLFVEFTPNFFSSLLVVLEKGSFYAFLHTFFGHALDNIRFYFSFNENPIYNLIKFSYIFIAIYFFSRVISNKSRIDIACLLVIVVNISMLIFFYDAYAWREVRILAPIYYFSCLFITLQTSQVQKYILLIFLCPSFFYASFHNPNDDFQNQYPVKEMEELSSVLESSISDLDINEQNNVVLVNFLLSYKDYEMVSFPIKTKNNIPLRYIIPYYEVEKVKYFFVLDRDKEGKLFFRKRENKK